METRYFVSAVFLYSVDYENGKQMLEDAQASKPCTETDRLGGLVKLWRSKTQLTKRCYYPVSHTSNVHSMVMVFNHASSRGSNIQNSLWETGQRTERRTHCCWHNLTGVVLQIEL